MTERSFQKKFIEYVRPKNLESKFIQEFPLYFGAKTKKNKATRSCFPQYNVEVLQIDKNLDFHLWELKNWNSARGKEDLITGKVIGQIVFYDNHFMGNNKEEILNQLSAKGVQPEVLKNIEEKDQAELGFNFKTWNILVCGGEGWEIIDLKEPYLYLSKRYFKDITPQINLYQFYQTPRKNWDVRHILQIIESFYLWEASGVPTFDSIKDQLSIQCPEGNLDPEIYKLLIRKYPNLAKSKEEVIEMFRELQSINCES